MMTGSLPSGNFRTTWFLFLIRNRPWWIPQVHSSTGWEVLDTLLIMLQSWDLAHKSRITYHDDPWCQGWPRPPSLQSGTFSVLQVWLRGQGVLDTHLFMLESWDLAHKARITYPDNPLCKKWPHPPSIQLETINFLQVWLRGWDSW